MYLAFAGIHTCSVQLFSYLFIPLEWLMVLIIAARLLLRSIGLAYSWSRLQKSGKALQLAGEVVITIREPSSRSRDLCQIVLCQVERIKSSRAKLNAWFCLMTAKVARSAEVRSNSLFVARILALITALNHHQGFCEREVYQPNVQPTDTLQYTKHRLATTPYWRMQATGEESMSCRLSWVKVFPSKITPVETSWRYECMRKLLLSHNYNKKHACMNTGSKRAIKILWENY